MLSFFKKKQALTIEAHHVVLDVHLNSKMQVLQTLSHLAHKLGACSNEQSILQAFIEREQLGSTGVGYGFAIPHARHQDISQATVLFCRTSQVIADWESMDEQPIFCAIALLIPEVSAKEHLKILSSIATKLLDEQFTQALKKEPQATKIAQLLQAATKESQ